MICFDGATVCLYDSLQYLVFACHRLISYSVAVGGVKRRLRFADVGNSAV